MIAHEECEIKNVIEIHFEEKKNLINLVASGGFRLIKANIKF